MLGVIPFSGFYESWHDAEIGKALGYLCETEDQGNANQALLNYAMWKTNFQPVYEKYARAYAEAFCEKYKIKAEFESLQSPREYNFTTDRIYIKLSTEEVERLFDEVKAETLQAVCKEKFTSRSGFISFYKPDFREWGSPDTWDHNQVYALILATVIDKDGEELHQEGEVSLMESTTCNGHIEEWLLEQAPVERVARIADYLRARKERT